MSRKVKKGRRWAQWRRRNEPIESIMVVEHVRPDPALAAPRRLAKYDAIVEEMRILRVRIAAVEDGLEFEYLTKAERHTWCVLHAERAALELRRRELATGVLKRIRLNDWVEKPMYSTLDARFSVREEGQG